MFPLRLLSNLFFAHIFIALSISCHASNILWIPNANDPSPTALYFSQLLKLALEKTQEEYGATTVSYNPITLGRERQRTLIATHSGLDVMWSSTNSAREQQLLAIHVNLLRELSDYKLLMIRKEDQAEFDKIKNLTDLQKFKAGTGSHWQDTKILELNDMPLITSWDYEPMFKMLRAKRFDYMIRGAQEIQEELRGHSELNLTTENHLIVEYHLPVYFFVAKENADLANRIKLGLQRANQDGSWEKLFLKTPGFSDALRTLQDKKRLRLKMKDSITKPEELPATSLPQ